MSYSLRPPNIKLQCIILPHDSEIINLTLRVWCRYTALINRCFFFSGLHYFTYIIFILLFWSLPIHFYESYTFFLKSSEVTFLIKYWILVRYFFFEKFLFGDHQGLMSHVNPNQKFSLHFEASYKIFVLIRGIQCDWIKSQ